VDIGANVGYFTCLACSLRKHVVAVEPLWSNLRYLCENLQANGWNDDVEIYPVGLADKPGLARLYGGGTGASLVPDWAGIAHSFGCTIPLSTLDIILGNRFQGERIVIKMDVEGAEYHALRGASSIMKVVPAPIWLIEITLTKHRNGSRNPHFLDTFEFFWDRGYRSVSIGQECVEVHPEDIKECQNTNAGKNQETDNYLFFHGSQETWPRIFLGTFAEVEDLTV
jgi:FkbM family methyltransferase